MSSLVPTMGNTALAASSDVTIDERRSSSKRKIKTPEAVVTPALDTTASTSSVDSDVKVTAKNQPLTSESLAAMVKNEQFAYLRTNGGALGLAAKLKSDALTGLPLLKLGSTFIEQRKEQFGSNALPTPTVPNYFYLIWKGLHDVTLIMLIASATASLVTSIGFGGESNDSWIEGVAILATVALVVNVQAFTDWSKAKQFRAQQLELEGAKSVAVLRDGDLLHIHPRELLVGDVLRMAVGDILAADGVLIEGSDIKMDESALTGESKLVVKGSNKECNPAGMSPFILSGTNVMSGLGIMLVVAVGVHSLQGSILATVGQITDDSMTTSDNKIAPIQVIVDQEGNGSTADGSTTKPKERKKRRGCFGMCGKVDQGGNLMTKLNTVALNIGTAGLVAAGIAFTVMVGRWAVQEFTGEDAREWAGADDIQALLGYFITAVTILVVAVPEGLPLAVTLSLAVSMRRMTKDNNQVKFMESCETMGSATTICSDKTGTLTQNRMTAVRITMGKDSLVQDPDKGLGESLLNSLSSSADGGKAVATLLADAISLNASATSAVHIDENGVWIYQGNPTECALLKFVHQLKSTVGVSPKEIRESPKNKIAGNGLDWGVKTFPFSSERKMMSWVVPHPTKPGAFRLYSKGAPNQIFANCTSTWTKDGVAAFDSDMKKYFDQQIQVFQDLAMRTLAVAYKDMDAEPANGWNAITPESKGNPVERFVAEQEFTLLALFGIEDPLRPEVVDAIKRCNSAGVDVRMCTGDALATAVAIASQCGILRAKDLISGSDGAQGGSVTPKPDFAMTGAEFDERVYVIDRTKPKVSRRAFDMESKKEGELITYPFAKDDEGNKILDQQAFDSIWPKLRVLARCQPDDKLTLVRGMRMSQVFRNEEYCRSLKTEHDIDVFPDYQVVAVTGDGTNDAPALKNADVGFAMGLVGTDIAKQACDIILMDDNFASIVKAVLWGRNVYDSISKFIQFQLTVNISAITVAIVGAFVFNASPLSAVQMLWVNIIMDSLASLALATEPPSEVLLERQPYGKRRPIVSRTMFFNMIGQALFQLVVVMTILFYPNGLPGNVEFYPSEFYGGAGNSSAIVADDSRRMLSAGADEESVHWTIVFNVFVLMQLFNEFNSRHLQTVDRLRSNWSEWNVFVGITKNPVFIVVVITTMILQVVIVQFGGKPFGLIVGGISLAQWGVCIGIGAFSLIWQLVINASLLYYTAVFGEERAVSGGGGTDDELSDAAARKTKRNSVLPFVRPDSSFAFTKEADDMQARFVRQASAQMLEERHPNFSI